MATERTSLHVIAEPGNDDRVVRLVRGAFPRWPAYDIAVRRALLQGIGRGEQPETFRLYTPPPTVAFGRQDVQRPAGVSAADAVRRHRFVPARRFAGSRTVALHEGVLVFEHFVHDPRAQVNFAQRNVETAGAVAQALRDLGVDSRIGDVFREYAPGAYSVNARGQVKLASIEQRLIPGAAFVTGIIVVSGADRLRDVLVVANRQLGFDWEAATLGSIEDELGTASVAAVGDAILTEFQRRHIRFVEGRVPDEILQVAQAFEPEHEI